MIDSMYLAEMVRFHRKKARLSQADLGRLAGVGKTVVYDLEHGKATVRLSTVSQILDALNIRVVFESPLMAAFSQQRVVAVDREASE